MKAVICLCALVVAAIARPEEKYTDKYDSVDIKQIISNRRLLLPYIKCLLGLGKCTADGNELKSHVTDALKTYCARCTQKQQESTKLVIGHLIKHEPDYWKQLCDKYDPERKYATKYEEELKNLN